MTYELEFDPRAWREWQKPGETVKKQFKNKLQQIVQNPRIESARLSDLPDCYKIKLKRQVIGWCIKYEIVWWWFTLLPLAKERKRPFIIRRINGSKRYRK